MLKVVKGRKGDSASYVQVAKMRTTPATNTYIRIIFYFRCSKQIFFFKSIKCVYYVFSRSFLGCREQGHKGPTINLTVVCPSPTRGMIFFFIFRSNIEHVAEAR